MTTELRVQKENGNPSHELWWKPLFSLQREMNRSLRQTYANFLHPSFMTPALWDAEENMFEIMQHNTHRLFSEMFNHRQMTTPWLTGDMTEPYVDIIENGTTFKIQADVPGLDAEDLEVSVSDSAITIEGSRKDEVNDEGDTYIRRECHCGTFSRTIALPDEVDLSKATATFDHNVLTIEAPKKPEALEAARKLEINVSEQKPKKTATKRQAKTT